jgi:hypothetical protein
MSWYRVRERPDSMSKATQKRQRAEFTAKAALGAIRTS